MNQSTRIMRVRTNLHEQLHTLAAEEGVSMQVILEKALEQYRRDRMFKQANEGYAALRADPEAWQQELAERE